ncbi:MAG: IS66 family transposase [Acidobacteria bacterium]|nr:IS66 family transposase [Acidobacteriota bacterium]
MSYQEPKNKDYGINSCEGCLAKQQIIDRQFEEITRLKQKLQVNQRKSTDGFFGLSTPSSQIPVKANSLAENQAKKGGAQIGHVGVGRQIFSQTEADEMRIAEVSAETCPGCECRLSRLSSNERGIYEIEREQVRKIYYEIGRKVCPKCRTIVSGRARNALARVALSNELVVEVAEQHYVLGRTLGQIAERFGINYSTLADSLKRVGKLIEPALERLKTDYRQSLVRHADETSWRTDGGNGYSWYFGSQTVSLHLFRETRSASVVREVLGTAELNGVLVVDRYAGYNQVPCEIQYCYAHLLREMKDLEQEFENNVEIKSYTAQMKLHLTDAMQLRKRGFTEAEYQAEAAKIKSKILELSNRRASHPAIRKWQDFFVEKAARLFQWCQNASIPAENNYAEREIRKVVIARKMSYGSQSAEGAKTRETWTSILQTLKKREANPRDKLVNAFNKLSQTKDLDITAELFGSLKF